MLADSGTCSKKQRELAVAEIGQEHGFEHATETRNSCVSRETEPLPGIEIRARAGLLGKRIVVAVVIAHRVAVVEVAAGTAELLDPGMLIRRNGLGSELAPDPIGFLREHDAHAVAEGGERGCETTDSAADNGHVAVEFAASPRRMRRRLRKQRRQSGRCGIIWRKLRRFSGEDMVIPIIRMRISSRTEDRAESWPER